MNTPVQEYLEACEMWAKAADDALRASIRAAIEAWAAKQRKPGGVLAPLDPVATVLALYPDTLPGTTVYVPKGTHPVLGGTSVYVPLSCVTALQRLTEPRQGHPMRPLLFSLLIGAFIALSALAGCGGGGSDAEDDVPPPRSTVQPVNCSGGACR